MAKINTGRNLPLAILVGVSLISLVILTLFINKFAFTFLAWAAVVIAGYEITNQLNIKLNLTISKSIVMFLISLFIFLPILFGQIAIIYAIISTIILLTIFISLSSPQNKIKDLKYSFFTVLYLGLFGSLAILMLLTKDGAQRVFMFIAITAISDTGGYFAGIIFGKTKLAPKISPNKSYEGLIGSIFFAIIFSIFVVPYFLDLSLIENIILGLVLAITGTIGDLFESYIKRKLSIKDFSTFLPGHGGMADRIDSLAFNSLFSFLLFGLFLGFM